MKSHLIFLLTFCAIWNACQNKASGPEAIVEKYVSLIYQGELQQAKAMCTPAAAAYLGALQGVIDASESRIDPGKVKVVGITCYSIEGDYLYSCSVLVNDGFEEASEVYYVRKTASGWQIDRPPPDVKPSIRQETLTQ